MICKYMYEMVDDNYKRCVDPCLHDGFDPNSCDKNQICVTEDHIPSCTGKLKEIDNYLYSY